MIKIKGQEEVCIERSTAGVPHVIVKNEADVYFGMGYCHAMDRGIQMMLMRTLGQGRGSELLDSSEEMLQIDLFFRQMNWSFNLDSELEKFDRDELRNLTSYCDGINQYFSTKKPWELRLLLGFSEFKWEISDIILICRMSGFLTLAQSQGEIERLFIQMVQAGVSKEKLQELFPGVLEEYDESLLKKIKLKSKCVPDEVKWNTHLNPLMASNNWAISGDKTRSNSPILSNDPHLEINRLPPVWYEISFTMGRESSYAATIPGISALLIGRNNHLAWGATYTFMDAMDSWIEECHEGKYKKDEAWCDFQVRKEIIKRKKKPAYEAVFYENEHGVLEGDAHESGLHLSTCWSGRNSGVQSLKSGFKMWKANNVEEGMNNLGKIELSFNWVLTDDQGNIGYQMSGLLPIRNTNASGFAPMPGWTSEYDWQGFHPHDKLPKSYNPKENFIVTANENLSEYGEVNPHTITMGDYRSERIKQLLRSKNDYTVEDIMEMHYDVYSIQAEKFMRFILPLLPESENGTILKTWDCRYTTDSKGAYLFEQVYKALYAEILGDTLSKFLWDETGIFIDFYENFDRVLLAEKSIWFEKRNKKELYQSAIKKGLSSPAKTWGSINHFDLTHMLLGNKLPKSLGFDKGPFPLPGNRATIHQGQVYNNAGRKTTFAPSFRMITDMAEQVIHSNISGGASDRRFSKYYANDFKNWQSGIYKVITLSNTK